MNNEGERNLREGTSADAVDGVPALLAEGKEDAVEKRSSVVINFEKTQISVTETDLSTSELPAPLMEYVEANGGTSEESALLQEMYMESAMVAKLALTEQGTKGGQQAAYATLANMFASVQADLENDVAGVSAEDQSPSAQKTSVEGKNFFEKHPKFQKFVLAFSVAAGLAGGVMPASAHDGSDSAMNAAIRYQATQIGLQVLSGVIQQTMGVPVSPGGMAPNYPPAYPPAPYPGTYPQRGAVYSPVYGQTQRMPGVMQSQERLNLEQQMVSLQSQYRSTAIQRDEMYRMMQQTGAQISINPYNNNLRQQYNSYLTAFENYGIQMQRIQMQISEVQARLGVTP